MDPYKLLSRSTRIKKNASPGRGATVPSSGPREEPRLDTQDTHESQRQSTSSRKRKRGDHALQSSAKGSSSVDFFNDVIKPSKRTVGSSGDGAGTSNSVSQVADASAAKEQIEPPLPVSHMPEDKCRSLLKENKIKVTWLNAVDGLPPVEQKKVKRKHKAGAAMKQQLFPQPVQSFSELSPRFQVSKRLSNNVVEQGYTLPTEVQLAALPLLLAQREPSLSITTETTGHMPASLDSIDLLTVAPTGSGKTIAFLIPLLHNILRYRQSSSSTSRGTTALVLAPTKELVAQIVNEGKKLAKGTGVQITQVRKRMRMANGTLHDQEIESDKKADEVESASTIVKADVLVSTPGLLHSLISEVITLKSDALSGILYMVLDEADVLLDPLFRDQTLGIWNALPNQELRVSLWSATMGSNIEELARSVIDSRRARLGGIDDRIPEAPVARLVVGLKDSAVPNVQHKLVYAATEQGKLMGLRQLIHPSLSSNESGPPLRPPFLVFTQTIERAVALHSELLYDIPAEAGGISRIAVLHSDLSDTARDGVMTRFRKGEIWILITTDLLSRGVDFRGINGVVNYDIPTSSAAYVHRVGRTGRAGREGGVAVTLYSKEDIPYLKHIANVVAIAQKQGAGKSVVGREGLQQWLLDALPTLSKQDKQKLRKRGVESRTSRGKESDPKAARKARISTKSGYLRKSENNRRGAVLGSQRRSQAENASQAAEDSDSSFGGFD